MLLGKNDAATRTLRQGNHATSSLAAPSPTRVGEGKNSR